MVRDGAGCREEVESRALEGGQSPAGRSGRDIPPGLRSISGTVDPLCLFPMERGTPLPHDLCDILTWMAPFEPLLCL